MKFLGNILATIIGLFIFCMLFFFGIVIIGSVVGGDDKAIVVKENSVIQLDLDGIELDYAGKFSDSWFKNLSDEKTVGFIDVLNAIKAAKADENIQGISILNNSATLGMAQTKELRNALEDFKKSGKFIFAYSNYSTQKEYYLNSVANSVYLNPAGMLDFKGLGIETMYYKDFQEKTGVKMEVIRHGKYKSAVEPFLENKMSDANREQLTALLESVWNNVVGDIAQSRKVSVVKLNEVANGLLARTPKMAKNEKLIDRVAYEDEYHAYIKKRLKVKADEEYNSIDILDYTENYNSTETPTATDKIAVIYAQGEILGGEGSVNEIGEGAMRRSLKEARTDKNVKAIVLRIDSPGGSALTSDLIWREIGLTKKVKPVVVSMGNVAASGGYYIACNASKIFAENTTITGSIGVFGMLPNFSQLSTKIGLNTEQVRTHDNAIYYSPFKPLDEKSKAFMVEGVEGIYNTFVQHVAQGRKMSFEAVDAIAQGRVWTGEEALKIGLVDEIGGLEKALAEAAKLGKVKEYATVNYPEFHEDFKDFLAGFPFSSTKQSLIETEIGAENYKMLKQIKQIQAIKGNQVRLPFEVNIK
jgi:protease IV